MEICKNVQGTQRLTSDGVRSWLQGTQRLTSDSVRSWPVKVSDSGTHLRTNELVFLVQWNLCSYSGFRIHGKSHQYIMQWLVHNRTGPAGLRTQAWHSDLDDTKSGVCNCGEMRIELWRQDRPTNIWRHLVPRLANLRYLRNQPVIAFTRRMNERICKSKNERSTRVKHT
jgi:hypothetical protein